MELTDNEGHDGWPIETNVEGVNPEESDAAGCVNVVQRNVALAIVVCDSCNEVSEQQSNDHLQAPSLHQ